MRVLPLDTADLVHQPGFSFTSAQRGRFDRLWDRLQEEGVGEDGNEAAEADEEAEETGIEEEILQVLASFWM